MKDKVYKTSFEWGDIDGYMGDAFTLLHRSMVDSITMSIYKERFSRDVPKKGAYPFIPKGGVLKHIATFMALKEIIGKPDPKFCDAGCGIGNIMLLAKAAGFVVYGVEYDPRLVWWAKRLCSYSLYDGYNTGTFGGIQTGDLTKNARRWKKFDVVYYYCPMRDLAMENKFEMLLEDNLKVGGFIVAHLKVSGRIQNDSRFVRVYLKDKNGRQILRDGIAFQKVSARRKKK